MIVETFESKLHTYLPHSIVIIQCTVYFPCVSCFLLSMLKKLSHTCNSLLTFIFSHNRKPRRPKLCLLKTIGGMGCGRGKDNRIVRAYMCY